MSTLPAKIRNAALDVLFPRGALCLCCSMPRGVDPDTALCPDCARKLDALRLRQECCPRCMAPVERTGYCVFCAQGRMKGIDRAYGAYRYQGEARQLIRLMKFSWQNEPAAALALGMEDALPMDGWDALVPVPLHARRQRVRGANQAMLLCERIARDREMPVLEALQRITYTDAQSSLNREKRLRNIKNAFRLAEGAEVRGKALLIVDDVRTTGATARECARVLRRGGAKKVGLLTAAIA
ncbi:MAG: ComF family protein [Clostridia bacterium]|nr:ComF family protein [Clostridia bacterium]